jgi:hypothetical protein
MSLKCRNDFFKAFKDGEIDNNYADRHIKHWEDIVGFKGVNEIFGSYP